MIINIPLEPHFKNFIKVSRTGKRLKKDGVVISPGTIQNYQSVYNLLVKYEKYSGHLLEIPLLKGNNMREFKMVQKLWARFYNNFLEYLHKERKIFDNYSGLIIKTLRTFFNWMRDSKGLSVGNFHKNMYVRKEVLPVITFSKEQLKRLMFCLELDEKLPDYVKRSKKMLVIGCITGLRFSDLIMLKKSDFIHRDGNYYISNKSKKTGISTLIMLPDIGVEFINSLKNKGIFLFLKISLTNFNKHIKQISNIAGWTHGVERIRTIRGKVLKRNVSNKTESLRFCDIVSSHIMRRTAITSLLVLGVSERTVRKISGHSESSSSFARYVNLAQAYQDNELEKAHLKLKE